MAAAAEAALEEAAAAVAVGSPVPRVYGSRHQVVLPFPHAKNRYGR